MSTKPGDLGGAKPAGKGLSGWIKTHQKQAAFGGVAIGVVILALVKKKSSASTTAAASTASSAIDPATGLPYSEELAAAQSASSGTGLGGSGYYGSGSGGYGSDGGGGYGSQLGTDITGLDTAITSLQAQISNPSGVNPGGLVQPATPVGPATFVAPAGYNGNGSQPNLLLNTPTPASGVTPVQPAVPVASTPIISAPSAVPIASNQSDAAAAAAYASGSETASAALQSETAASAETAAQRHAQEVANKSLRAAAK